MVLFKLNGERNSGLNVLQKFLLRNNIPCQLNVVTNNIVLNWAHSSPSQDNKSFDEKVIDVFVFRNLRDWIIGMWSFPFNLEVDENTSLIDFMEMKQKSDGSLKNIDDENINSDDNDKTIFQIRYNKFSDIVNYKNQNSNVVFVNFDYLKNNLKSITQSLVDKYMESSITVIDYPINSSFRTKNVTVSEDEITQVINTNKNSSIESFISNLTVQFE